MELPSEIISEFAKITKSWRTSKAEQMVYGTAVDQDGTIYVKIDGSEQLTPVSTVADVKDGERVMVLIKNHSATITGNVSSPSARVGDVDDAKASIANLTLLVADKISASAVEAKYATIDSLKAVDAKIDEITATDITTKYLEANYALIDMANVDTAVIRQGFLESLMVSQGIIADRIVGTEVTATNVLTGVKIYADDITAGTLSVDRLVLRGSEKSLVYALNNSGELVSKQVDTLDACILTDRTITADKIVAGSITANEIAVGTITANQIATEAITADKINISDLFAQNITASGTISGVKIEGATGEFTKGFSVKVPALQALFSDTYFNISSTDSDIFIGITGSTGGQGTYPYLKIDDTNIYMASNQTTIGITESGAGISMTNTLSMSSCQIFIKNRTITLSSKKGDVYDKDQGTSTVSIHGSIIDIDTTTLNVTGSVEANSFVGGLSGNAATATKLAKSVPFSIGGASKTFDGTSGLTWTLAEIGAAAKSHTHSYLPLTGGTLSGPITVERSTAGNYIRTKQGNYIWVVRGNSSGGLNIGQYNSNGDNVKNSIVTSPTGDTFGAADDAANTNLTRIRGNTVRLYAHTGGGVYLGSSGSTAVTSDENLKDLYELNDNYDTFYDGLLPKTYKYKKDGCHRLHVGFGARQVEQALVNAGLSTEDFAGVLIDKDVTISADEAGAEEDVHYDELYSLRYEEFISLNTWQIQKLKRRLAECENVIGELNQKIIALEQSA